jgi:hypothetical protein
MPVRGPAETQTSETLGVASLFLCVATADDIEHERQLLEARYHRQLAVHERESVTRSGARCTRITWRILS